MANNNTSKMASNNNNNTNRRAQPKQRSLKEIMEGKLSNKELKVANSLFKMQFKKK